MSLCYIMAGESTGATPQIETSSLDWDYSTFDNIYDTEKKSIKENIVYHENLLEYFKGLEDCFDKEGRDAAVDYEKREKGNLPKKPVNFTFIKRLKKSDDAKLESLEGKKLLDRLAKLKADRSTVSGEDIPEFDELECDVDKVKQIIKEGKSCIEVQENNSLCLYVKLGLWLEHYFKLDSDKFISLLQELQLSVRFVRKLRKTAILFNKYRQLQLLSVSQTTALTITSKLEKALTDHPEEAAKWK